jgi:hypothetical protein
VRSICFVFAALTQLVACTDDDTKLGQYASGCSVKAPYCNGVSPPASYPSPDAGAPRPPPEACAVMRTQSPRADMTSDELRALLPGHYQACSFDGEIDIVLERGSLVANGEQIVVGSCGTSSCEMLWRGEIGAAKVWTDPATMFSFSSERLAESGYVRISD